MINHRKKVPIVRSQRPIAVVGGGEIGAEDLNLALIRVSAVVAADGGAIPVMAAGRMPDAVIGDFDSLDADHLDRIPEDRLFHIDEQDSTDFDKSLRSVEAPLVLGVGFLGGRLDHQLAVLNSLVRLQDHPCILLGEHEIAFHTPPRISIPLDPGDVVSLFPFRRVTGRSQGLKWPIDGLVLEPDGRVGTSNQALGNVTLSVDGPGLVAMVPRRALNSVMQAFLDDQTGRWPSRADLLAD